MIRLLLLFRVYAGYRRAGDLGLGLVHQHLVEAHGVLTVLLAGRSPGRRPASTEAKTRPVW